MVEWRADAASDARDHAAAEVQTGDREVRRIRWVERQVRLVGKRLLREGCDTLHRTENRAKPGQVIADMLVSAAPLVFMEIGPGRSGAAAPSLRIHAVDHVVVEFSVDDPRLADRSITH